MSTALYHHHFLQVFFAKKQVVVCPYLFFHHLVLLFFVLLLHAVCFAEQITRSSWKPLHALISLQNALHDVRVHADSGLLCLF